MLILIILIDGRIRLLTNDVDFAKRFTENTSGLFDGLDWANVIISGVCAPSPLILYKTSTLVECDVNMPTLEQVWT